MKSLLLIASVLFIAAPSISQKSEKDFGLPELYKINRLHFRPATVAALKRNSQRGMLIRRCSCLPIPGSLTRRSFCSTAPAKRRTIFPVSLPGISLT